MLDCLALYSSLLGFLHVCKGIDGVALDACNSRTAVEVARVVGEACVDVIDVIFCCRVEGVTI